jgi:hypothetical protein
MDFAKSNRPFLLFFVVLFFGAPASVLAQAPGVDSAAVAKLQRMTDYVRNMDRFAVHAENTLEDLLESGQRADFDMAADIVVNRPNQVFAERTGALANQFFYYDGKTVTLFQPQEAIYFSGLAPETIEEMIDYAREDLGIVFPISDLVYDNAFAILMEGVTSASVVGKAVIGGVSCDHLVFARPDVQFQVWIADGEQPLPCKYVVTDISTPGNISTVSVLTNWNLSPVVTADTFKFIPSARARAVEITEID